MPMPSPPNWRLSATRGWLLPIRHSRTSDKGFPSILFRDTRSRNAREQRLATSGPRRSSSSHRLLPAQWQEVLRPLDRLRHLAQQLLQVFVAVDEINVRSVDDQQV